MHAVLKTIGGFVVGMVGCLCVYVWVGCDT
jgi:hypothetical protein